MHRRNRIAPTEGLELNPIKNDGQTKFYLLSNFQATISKTADVLICKFHHGFSFTLPFYLPFTYLTVGVTQKGLTI